MDSGARTFTILIAYENFEDGIRASKVAEDLTARLGSDLRIISDTWKFELIGHPRLQEFIARATDEADVIIIAARGGEELPAWVKGWLETWVSCHRRDPVALVALSNDGPAGEDSFAEPPAPVLREYLSQVAAHGHFDFFWCGDESEALGCLENGVHQRQDAAMRRDQLAGAE